MKPDDITRAALGAMGDDAQEQDILDDGHMEFRTPPKTLDRLRGMLQARSGASVEKPEPAESED